MCRLCRQWCSQCAIVIQNWIDAVQVRFKFITILKINIFRTSFGALLSHRFNLLNVLLNANWNCCRIVVPERDKEIKVSSIHVYPHTHTRKIHETIWQKRNTLTMCVCVCDVWQSNSFNFKWVLQIQLKRAAAFATKTIHFIRDTQTYDT